MRLEKEWAEFWGICEIWLRLKWKLWQNLSVLIMHLSTCQSLPLNSIVPVQTTPLHSRHFNSISKLHWKKTNLYDLQTRQTERGRSLNTNHKIDNRLHTLMRVLMDELFFKFMTLIPTYFQIFPELRVIFSLKIIISERGKSFFFRNFFVVNCVQINLSGKYFWCWWEWA